MRLGECIELLHDFKAAFGLRNGEKVLYQFLCQWADWFYDEVGMWHGS